MVFFAAYGAMVVYIFDEERYEHEEKESDISRWFREKSCKEIIHDLLENNTSEWNYKLMKAREKRREEIKNATKKDKI